MSSPGGMYPTDYHTQTSCQTELDDYVRSLKFTGGVHFIAEPVLARSGHEQIKSVVQACDVSADASFLRKLEHLSTQWDTENDALQTRKVTTLEEAALLVMDYYWRTIPIGGYEVTSYSCIQRLLEECVTVESAVQLKTATSPRLVDQFDIRGLRLVKPDLAVGVASIQMKVQHSADNAVDKTVDIADLLYARGVLSSLRCQFAASALEPQFQYIFVEAEGSQGGRGTARVQNATAQRFGMELYRALYRQARAADAANCMSMPECVSHSFGIITSVEQWSVFVMVAPDIDDMEGSFDVAEIWNGNVSKVSQMAGFVALMQKITATGKERAEVISNWLWCLRSSPSSKSAGGQPDPERSADDGFDKNEEEDGGDKAGRRMGTANDNPPSKRELDQESLSPSKKSKTRGSEHSAGRFDLARGWTNSNIRAWSRCSAQSAKFSKPSLPRGDSLQSS